MELADNDMRAQEYLVVTLHEYRSTHDLIRDLLAYCAGGSVSFESIYAVVNAKLPQDRSAVATVLQAFPYFAPGAEPGTWEFRADVHHRVLAALAAGSTATVRVTVEPAPPQTAGEPSPTTQPAVPAPPKSSAVSRPAAQAKSPAPVSTTPDLPDLPLDVPPGAFLSVLELISCGRPLRPFDQAAAERAARKGWCSAAQDGYRLTPAGHELAGQAPADRTAAIENRLLKLPAFHAALKLLQSRKMVDGTALKETVNALPQALRIDPSALLLWLGWLVEQRQTGSVKGDRILLKPGARVI